MASETTPGRGDRIAITIADIAKERKALDTRLQVLDFKEAVGKFELVLEKQQKNNIPRLELDRKMLPGSDGKFVLLRYNSGFEVIGFDKDEFPRGYGYDVTPSASNLFHFTTDQNDVPVSLQIYDATAFEPGTSSIYNHPLGKEIPLNDQSISDAVENNLPLKEFVSMINSLE